MVATHPIPIAAPALPGRSGRHHPDPHDPHREPVVATLRRCLPADYVVTAAIAAVLLPTEAAR